MATLLAVSAIVAVVGASSVAVAAVATLDALQAGLPTPSRLTQLTYPEPTVVYDRTGKVKLATFGSERRTVLTFEQIPHLVTDATVATEDHTFWTNAGFDPLAILSAAAQDVASGSIARGASTITQQLVRARLLPASVVAPGANQYVRKAKEIVQAARVTAAFPGQAGKELIITAYLNQIFYGHEAYGIAAAARTYFGVTDLSKLTLSQVALLVGLPKAPTTLDPFLYAKPDAQGRLVVPPGSPPVQRRDFVLAELASSSSGTRWTRLTAAQVAAAEAQPVILNPPPTAPMVAPQFDLQVRNQLVQILGSVQALDAGGYRVITTLDTRAQQLAEKWVYAAAVLPNLPVAQMNAQIAALKIPASEAWWIRALRGRDPHDGALVALDYRTGDVLAYVGSAGYYLSNLAGPKFDPQFDVAGVGYRQPGSAWKPVMYSTGFEDRVFTPGTLLMDVSTPFSSTWTPHDADLVERGPVLLRQGLEYSLNVPAIRAYARVGAAAVEKTAAGFGITFPGGPQEFTGAGLTAAIGTVEVRLIDLLGAYGGLADGGLYHPTRMILEIDGPNGNVVYRAPQSQGRQVVTPQAAFLTDNILEANTDPSQNLVWGPMFHLDNGPGGQRRPAALKTGTTDGTRDLSAYGFLAPPADPTAPALAVGVWMGNSDHSNLGGVAFGADGPARVWHAFLNEYTNGWPLADWTPPSGVVRTTIDAFSGGAPGPWTRQTTREWFIDGTQPGSPGAIDPPGLLYLDCGGTWYVNPAGAEPGAPASWVAADADWARRAERGVGVPSGVGTVTGYLYGRSSWGGPVATDCAAVPSPTPSPTASPSPPSSPAPSSSPGATPTPLPSLPPGPPGRPTPTPPPALPVQSAPSPVSGGRRPRRRRAPADGRRSGGP